MKSNRTASIIIESNRIVRSVNRSGPSVEGQLQLRNVCAGVTKGIFRRDFH